MILCPLNTNEAHHTGQIVPIWQVIEHKQKQPAREWMLVAQPDHAALAGDLAERISSPLFPPRDDEILQAISLHDEGWASFDASTKVNTGGRPVSFIELPPSGFIPAWLGSIDRAEEVAPIAGIMVSGHFCRLGSGRLRAAIDTPSDSAALSQFLDSERQRQQRLERQQTRSSEEIRALVDLLQFCDVLSLYLCCGSCADVEFPQKFKSETMTLHRQGEMCVLKPTVFGSGASLAVSAKRFPCQGESVSIPALLS